MTALKSASWSDTKPIFKKPVIATGALSEKALTIAEQQYQRSLTKTVILLALLITPLIGAGYVWAYVNIARVWPTLTLALTLFGFLPVSLFALWYFHRGSMKVAIRVLLTWMLITSSVVTILLTSSLLLIGIIVAVMIALLALFLEPSRIALRWVLAAAIIYIASLFIRSVARAPIAQLGIVETVFLYIAPLCMFLTIALLGRSTIEFLRGTLRESETVRAQAVESFKQAQHATMVANEANRLKSEFLSMMSHELRTPLNAIIGFAGIMLGGMGGSLDQDATHMVHRINSNSLHLLELINNILDLAKVEARQLKPVNAPYSPAQLIRQQHEQMIGLATNKEIKFDIEIDPKLPETVVGDKDIVRRIVNNLLSNAFKFTEAGSIKLSAGMGHDNKKWTISVSDTGIGIPPHARDYIFDPFRQIDGSSSRQYSGTGLGLAIVKQMAQEIDAFIRVESALGKGSTFTVEIPTTPTVETNTAVAAR